MVTASGRESAALSERFQGETHRFDFFQAVRLLERLAREGGLPAPRAGAQPVGLDHAPEQECVRFRALPSLSFPTAAASRVRLTDEAPTPEVAVAFLGLTGPSGVLPAHYTALLMRRVRAKDTSLRDLLDLFNHRLVSLFYRAWEKYRLPFAYERSWRGRETTPQQEITPQQEALYSLVGQGTAGQRGRQEIPDEAFLFYGGHFAHQPRSAAALELMLADYFGLPVQVLELQGQWLCLERDDQAQLPSPRQPRGLNNRLGLDLVVGERVWGVQSKFRLRVGPLTYRQFVSFLPRVGKRLRPFSQMARSYVGPELVFDVQLVLLAAEVPRLRLGADGEDRPYLGWNTWINGGPATGELDDAVFAEEHGQGGGRLGIVALGGTEGH
jgi:type VI secretion system protein ImpH